MKFDIVQDNRRVYYSYVKIFAKRTEMIILGGVVIKHHITNACFGAESPVYNNTNLESDIVMQVLATDEVVS
jgi:deoxyhypusine synthase